MLTEERHTYILDKINRNKSVKLMDLVVELNTSESTVRRDLDELENAGLLKRVRGGAIGAGNIFTNDNTITERSNMNLNAKIAIAKYCSELIEDGDFIYLDSGTTTNEIIPFLRGKDVVVVTNGVFNAERLMENNIKSYLIGGRLKKVTKTIVGEQALVNLSDYRFNKAFIGANGITFNSSITTPDVSEAIIKNQAIKRSKEAFVVADSSKFGKVSFARICELGEVCIVTDLDLSKIDTDIKDNSKILIAK